MNTVRKLIRKYPLVFLLVCVFLTAAFSYFYYVFKGYGFFFHDIGSDTSELYLPMYESIARHLRSGDLSLWDLSYGLGASMYTQNLFHPTMLLLYILGAVFGPEKISSFLIVLHIVHILLSGLAAYVFLSSFKNISLRSRLLIAYIYSFNGYLVTWGQHYTFGLVTAFFPLILAMIERSLTPLAENGGNLQESRRRSNRAVIGLVLITAVLAMSTYYFSYMICLGTAFYTILRLLFLNGPVFTKLKLLISRGLFMVWGLLIGITYLLPSYLVLSQNSSRIASETGRLQTFIANLSPYVGDYYKTFFRRMVSSSMAGNGSHITDYFGYANFYEAPQLFMTGLMIILGLQFVFQFPRITKTLRQRIVLILSMLLLAFLVFVQAGSVMFNGFTYIFSRHLFIVFPILALMMAVTLDHIFENKRFSLIGGAAAAAFIAVICLSSVNKLEYRALKLNCLVILITSLLMIAGFILYSNKGAVSGQEAVPPVRKTGQMKPSLIRSFPFLLAVLAVIQVCGDTRSTVYARTDEAFASAREENLFGADASAVLEHLNTKDDSLFRTERTYVAGSYLMDAPSSGYYGYSAYNSTMNKYVIEFINKMIPESRLLDSDFRPTYRQIIGRSVFEDLLGIKYLITDDPSMEVNGYAPVFSSGSLTLLENPDVSFASFYTKAVSEKDYDILKEQMSPDEIAEKVIILDDQSSAGSSFLSADASSISAVSRSEASLLMAKPTKEGHLICQAEVPEDGYVLFPVPYEKGWTVRIDDVKTEMMKADFGFIAVKVSAGARMITLDYRVPYLLPCMLISLVSLAAFIFFCVTTGRRNKKKAF